MSEPAPHLVLVYGEPGVLVPEDRFNDWYDQEHIPALSAIPGLYSAARYKAVDGRKPSWLTLYDVASPDVIQGEEARKISAACSENERFITSNAAMLSHRIATLKVFRSLPQPPSSLRSQFVLAILMQPSSGRGDELVKWYEEEHMALFSKTPGWVRGRLYEVTQGPIETAGQASSDVTTNPTLKYLAVHELSTIEHLTGPVAQDSVKTPRGQEMLQDVGENREQRIFELYKDFRIPPHK